MNLVLDTHMHTLVSGHAYSTIKEMVEAGQEKGLELMAITEHGPKLRGSCTEVYFYNLRVIPRQYGNMELMMGAEADIMNFEGDLDLPMKAQKKLDYMIASMHLLTLNPGTAEQNTAGYLAAMNNPLVNTIGHIDDARYPIYMEEVVLGAKKTGTLLELNSSSMAPGSSRQNARENNIQMLQLCKKYGVPIILNSDAHISYDVGNLRLAADLVKEMNFPEELVANTSVAYFKELLQRKRNLFGLEK